MNALISFVSRAALWRVVGRLIPRSPLGLLATGLVAAVAFVVSR